MADQALLAAVLSNFIDDDDNDASCILLMNDECEELDAEIAATVAIADDFGEKYENRRGCVSNFYETTIPSFSSSTFRSHFRMRQSTMEVTYRR
jgi:hypothetical protein